MLLIGAPGVGKSLLAQALHRTHKSSCLCNVGQELRRMGLVEQYMSGPTGSQRQLLEDTARSIVQEACRALKETATTDCPRYFDGR